MEEQSNFKEKFRLMEEKLLQPDTRKSAEDLNTIIADEFIELGCSGFTYNKQQIMNVLPSLPTVKMTIMNFEAKLLSKDVVLTIYRVAKYSNKKVEYSLRSSIWMLQDDEWRIVFHQGTPSIAIQ
jgi:hypothetical protein